jgi:hypothetical protein
LLRFEIVRWQLDLLPDMPQKRAILHHSEKDVPRHGDLDLLIPAPSGSERAR